MRDLFWVVIFTLCIKALLGGVNTNNTKHLPDSSVYRTGRQSRGAHMGPHQDKHSGRGDTLGLPWRHHRPRDGHALPSSTVARRAKPVEPSSKPFSIRPPPPQGQSSTPPLIYRNLHPRPEHNRSIAKCTMGNTKEMQFIATIAFYKLIHLMAKFILKCYNF